MDQRRAVPAGALGLLAVGLPRVVVGLLARVLVAALIVMGPAVLLALAYASPPDPSWVPGVYDDADYDDIVALVLSASGALGPGGLTQLRPRPSVAGGLPPATEDAAPGPLLSQIQPRAPPLPA